jgi:hypothetical protein
MTAMGRERTFTEDPQLGESCCVRAALRGADTAVDLERKGSSLLIEHRHLLLAPRQLCRGYHVLDR